MAIILRSKRLHTYTIHTTKKCGKPITTKAVKYTSGDRYWAEPGDSSRHKPSSLIRNPTPLGRFYRIRYDYGCKYYTEENKKCDGFVQNTRYAIGQPTFHEAEYPDSLNAMMAARVKGMKINLASDLAEAKQTATAVTSLARALGQGMRSVYRASKGKGFKIPKSMRPGQTVRLGDFPVKVAGANLGISFGIAPLAGTVADSADRLKNRISYPIYRHLRGKIYGFVEGEGDGGIRWATDGSKKASIWVLLSETALGDDFTVGNPGEWAWELIPFSFVIDWMLPIGRAISNLDAFTGVGGMWGTMTERTQSLVASEYEAASGESSTIRWAYTWPRQTRGTRETYKRSVWVPDATPSVSWSPSTSFRSMANAISLLLVQRNKRIRL